MDNHALTEYLGTSSSGLIALYRFGSQAKETVRPDSDIGLAVLARDTIPHLRRLELAQDLVIQLHRDVDLVDVRSASTVMEMPAISTGTCLDAPAEPARRDFDMYADSDYAGLNEERRDLLERIANRGLVHG